MRSVLKEQETYAGFTIVQWALVAGALLLYCPLVQLEFFTGDSVQSSYLLVEMNGLDQPGHLNLADYQPIGVAALLNTITLHPPSDVIFRSVALLQGAFTLVFAALFFARSLRPEVSIAGGILLMHYTWAGALALLPFSWVGPLFALFLYALIKPKRPWILALTLVLCALVCPPLLAFLVPLLVMWFIGEWIARANRPELVRSTLNIGPVLRWKTWGIIGLGVIAAATLAVYTFKPLEVDWSAAPFSTTRIEGARFGYTSNFDGRGKLVEAVLAFPLALVILLLFGPLLGLVQRAGLTRFSLLLAALFVAFFSYEFALSFYQPDLWIDYTAGAYAISLLLPACVVLIVGFADHYFSKWYISVAAVLFILLWIPAYLPNYLT